jgi:hypothetical protein
MLKSSLTYKRTTHVPLVNNNNKCGTKERQVKTTSDRFFMTVACMQSGHGCWSDGWLKIRFHSFYYPTKNRGRITPVVADGGAETDWIRRRKE